MRRAIIPAAALAAALAALPGPSEAANARNPYGNVDRRVDAGNNTGNAETDRLNDLQLNRSRGGAPYIPAAPVPYAPLPPPAYLYGPPPGYYPPPAYLPPPPYYPAPGYYYYPPR